MTTLFVSDLHLQPERPAMTAIFLRFLENEARDADVLFILGDLFEVWVGDDLSMSEHGDVIQALGALSAAGVRIRLMDGNRDFLYGPAFFEATGCEALPDLVVEPLHGIKTALLHGDTLCTADVGYQRYRRVVRNSAIQWIYLHLPRSTRERIARKLRGESGQRVQQKASDIMDVTPSAVEALFRETGVTRMIHGHTHRPAVHDYEIDGIPCQRIVLSDWHDDRGSALRVSDSGFETVDLR